LNISGIQFPLPATVGDFAPVKASQM